MVGVPVGSVRTECDDYVGLNAPDMPDDVANGSRGRDFINSTVRKAQNRDFTDTEYSGGRSQFRFANALRLPSDRRALLADRSGRVLRVWL